MEFMIEPGRVRRAASDLDDCKKSVHAVWMSVNQVKNSCAIQGKSRSSVKRALDEHMEDLSELENSVFRMSAALQEISDVYEQTENRVKSRSVSGQTKKKNGTQITTQKEKTSDDDIKKWEWKWSDTWEVISKAGPAGAAVAVFGNLLTGNGDAETWINSGKFAAEGIEKGAKIVSSGTSTGWGKAVIGIDAAAKASTKMGETFKEALKAEFVDDLGFNGAPKTADKIAVGAKWAGHVLTFAGNAVENWNEKGISKGRAAAETVIETGADIFVGGVASAGATAVVGAAWTAAFGVAAPAVAVGVAAVGVTWAVNQAFEWKFGKDVGECVADVVCDAGEKMISGAKSVGKAVGKGVAKAADNVGKAFKSAGNAMKNIGTKWSKGIFAFA